MHVHDISKNLGACTPDKMRYAMYACPTTPTTSPCCGPLHPRPHLAVPHYTHNLTLLCPTSPTTSPCCAPLHPRPHLAVAHWMLGCINRLRAQAAEASYVGVHTARSWQPTEKLSVCDCSSSTCTSTNEVSERPPESVAVYCRRYTPGMQLPTASMTGLHSPPHVAPGAQLLLTTTETVLPAKSSSCKYQQQQHPFRGIGSSSSNRCKAACV